MSLIQEALKRQQAETDTADPDRTGTTVPAASPEPQRPPAPVPDRRSKIPMLVAGILLFLLIGSAGMLTYTVYRPRMIPPAEPAPPARDTAPTDDTAAPLRVVEDPVPPIDPAPAAPSATTSPVVPASTAPATATVPGAPGPSDAPREPETAIAATPVPPDASPPTPTPTPPTEPAPRPPEPTPAPTPPATAPPSVPWPRITLSGILAGPGGGAAVINQTVVGVGESIENVRVLEVSPQRVRLEYRGAVREARMGQVLGGD